MRRKTKSYKRQKPGRNKQKKTTINKRKKSTNNRKTINHSGENSAMHVRNANSRQIFRNEKLTCQFLRDYSEISVFDDLKPTDIEDVTGKYQAYLGVEFEADTVKKIRVRVGNEQQEIYVIPLIEHKSSVDYNVQMQLLRYMAVIWYDYGKQQNKQAKSKLTSKKSFRYPPIIPIVYYEGAKNWTADMELWRRIELGKELKAYIPDFSYKVIRVGKYTNEEIKKHVNEMSLVLLLNKIQNAENYAEFIKTSKDYMTEVLKDTPEDLMEILQTVFWALLMKMNVPQEDASDLMEHMGAKDMGYLFENAEKMDIQAERRNTQRVQKKLDQREDELTQTKDKLTQTEGKLDQMEMGIKIMIKNLIRICRQKGSTKAETRIELSEIHKIDTRLLDLFFEKLWNEE